MIKRLSERIPAHFEADIISDRERHTGVVDNLSKDGIHMKIPLTKTSINFPPGTTLDLEFQLISGETLKPSGEKLKLQCEVIWLDKNLPDGLTDYIGFEIIEPSSTYEEFLKIIYSMNMGIS